MAANTTGLEDRVVLVTGGGRGIGREIALGCAALGARVVVAARNVSELTETVRMIEASAGRGVALPVDITSEHSLRVLVDTVLEEYRSIDVLVNNAGVLLPGSVGEMGVTEFGRVMQVNVMGTFLAMQAVIPIMKERGGGKIINIASVFGLEPVQEYGAYGASKAAIIHLTKVAALELARHRIQVNAVAPGYVETAMSANVLADPELLQRVERRIPARRMAIAAELVPLVALLASDRSDYMTGSVVVIDGGFSL